MQTNFAHLYSRLALSPDSSADELRHAYRRRIAELHPDRVRDDARAAETGEELRELITLYAEASRFHRRHGRLPGASPPASRPASFALPRAPAPPPSTVAAPVTKGRIALLVGLLLLALVLIGISFSDDELGGIGSSQDAPSRASPVVAQGAQPAAREGRISASVVQPLQDTLELGMDAATVRAIQGEPMHASTEQWEYGPSWLRFADNRLIDWRSSPLHPLKTATDFPPPTIATP